MTDEIISNQGSDSQNNSTNENKVESAAPIEAATTEATKTEPVVIKEQTKPERTYTRDELAKITNAETKRAREQGRQDALEETKRSQAQQQNQQVSQPNAQQSSGNMSDEELAARIEKIAQQKSLTARMQQEAVDFHKKLDLENDPEMKLSYEKLNLGGMQMPFVHVLNSVDNAKDVVKEFANFPEKLTTILNTANLFGLEAGKDAMKRVSESIKKNREAANVKLPDAPISQIGPSNTGTDNGQMTAADYRKIYKGKY
jgi:hypothetical protein